MTDDPNRTFSRNALDLVASMPVAPVSEVHDPVGPEEPMVVIVGSDSPAGDAVVANNFSITPDKPRTFRITPRWKPGESGNPAGRPVGPGPLLRKLTHDGADIWQVCIEVMRGQHKARAADRLEACRMMVERIWGKVPQQTALVGPDGGPVQVATRDLGALTDAEIDALLLLGAQMDAIQEPTAGGDMDAPAK